MKTKKIRKTGIPSRNPRWHADPVQRNMQIALIKTDKGTLVFMRRAKPKENGPKPIPFTLWEREGGATLTHPNAPRRRWSLVRHCGTLTKIKDGVHHDIRVTVKKRPYFLFGSKGAWFLMDPETYALAEITHERGLAFLRWEVYEHYNAILYDETPFDGRTLLVVWRRENVPDSMCPHWAYFKGTDGFKDGRWHRLKGSSHHDYHYYPATESTGYDFYVLMPSSDNPQERGIKWIADGSVQWIEKDEELTDHFGTTYVFNGRAMVAKGRS